MDTDVKELVERAQNKDRDAFGSLFDLYYDKVLNYVFRRVLNTEYAKDITSNTFLKALKNLDQFEWRNGPFSFNGWIFKIATNEVNQYFRKQNRYKLTIDDPDFKELGDNNKIAEEIEKKIDNDKHLLILNKAIKQLKPIYQDILHLKYFEEMSYEEISQVLNKNESTIRVYSKRAKEELRIILEKDASEFLVNI
ncbi:MAG: sigma-70 family RNA polymerase sigma factor [Candidatus Paceibacterota bacterium]|jgi:RNA polymerase sigma-70 factor (ECF subfamily)